MARLGNVQITLVQPGQDTGEKDSFGAPIKGEPTSRNVWARRSDRGGSERISAETFLADSSTRWDVPTAALPRDVGTSWHIVAAGKTFDIVAVAEATGGLPGSMTWLYTRRRS